MGHPCHPPPHYTTDPGGIHDFILEYVDFYKNKSERRINHCFARCCRNRHRPVIRLLTMPNWAIWEGNVRGRPACVVARRLITTIIVRPMRMRPLSLLSALLAMASSLPLYRDTVKVSAGPSVTAPSTQTSPSQPGEEKHEPVSPSRLENIPSTGGSKADSCRSESGPRRLVLESASRASLIVGVRPLGLDGISAPAFSPSLPKVVLDRSTLPILRHAPPVVA